MNNAYIRAQQCKVKEAKFPFVKIGTQYWTTKNLSLAVTPQGNTIPEVQSNATWATSQTLYNNAYAATSGTVEQKTYAAVKAAAMCSNYNNDPILGGIYGKLYNWFAVKLFQMDIDYYNAANTTKKWANGFRIPIQAEFQSLSTYLGGDAVSGGHLKEAGLAHWLTPNTGADNSSGFSFINGGRRAYNTGFYSSDTYVRMWCSDLYSGTEAKVAQLSSADASLFLYHTNNGDGHFLRLIKY